MVEEVSYGYSHGRMSSVCLKFNALCNVFNATKGQGVDSLREIFKTNMGAFSTKRSRQLYPAKFHYHTFIPHWDNENEKYEV